MQLLIASIEHDLEIINDWFKANKLTLNKKKSVSIFFNSKMTEKLWIPDSLKIENSCINFIDHTKFLGVWIDKNLTWTAHTNRVIQKIQRNAHMLYQSKNLLSVHAKKILLLCSNLQSYYIWTKCLGSNDQEENYKKDSTYPNQLFEMFYGHCNQKSPNVTRYNKTRST